MNDTLKAIAASLLMEQVLAPRFEFRPKNPNNSPTPGYDYGPGGYDPTKSNVGVDPETGRVQLEIKGLAEPKSPEAERICREDLNELITAFVQDKPSIERGLFDPEVVPEELTQVRMGKIVKEKFPGLAEEDQEAVRQHAIAALNLVQAAKQQLLGGVGEASAPANTSLIDGVRKYALSVTDLDIDLIDRINPFGEAYEILAKSMTPARLKIVMEVIAARRVNLTLEEARDLAKRAVKFTESDLLLRSLQRALNKDKASRRITEPDMGPLFSNEENADDLPTGYIEPVPKKSRQVTHGGKREIWPAGEVIGGVKTTGWSQKRCL